MRIIDESNKEITEQEANLKLGYLKEERIFVKHHEAVKAQAPVYKVFPKTFYFDDGTSYTTSGMDDPHIGEGNSYEPLPNEEDKTVYGMDLTKVLIEPAVEPRDAYDEYEDVLVYHRYTQEQLNEIADKNNQKQQEKQFLATGEDRINELNEYLERQAKSIDNLVVMLTDISFGMDGMEEFPLEEEEMEE